MDEGMLMTDIRTEMIISAWIGRISICCVLSWISTASTTQCYDVVGVVMND